MWRAAERAARRLDRNAWSIEEQAMLRGAKEAVQRIKLRLHKHPVKLDASIVEMDPQGKWMDVRFDGPLADAKLWVYGEHLLSDCDPHGERPEGWRLFEVL